MINIAMIGAGRIAQAHAVSFRSSTRARLAWVADPVPGAAQALAERAGARATLEAKEAIEDPAVDAVMICSPTPTHVELIHAGVAAGKAVLCEKPIALDIDQVNECMTALDGLDPRVMMGFNRRFDPAFAQVKQQVDAGEIGAVEQVVIISRDPAPPPQDYVLASGGIFRDMTIHDLDMARFFLPDIVSVEATGQNMIEPRIADIGDYDGAITTLRASTGAVVTIVNSRRCAFGYDQRLEVFGATGMLRADNVQTTSVRSYGGDQVEAAVPYPLFFIERYRDAYAAELEAFAQTVESGAAFTPSLEDGRAALVLADAAGESARCGKAVAVDLI